jgi:hypothetical protein
MVMLLSEVTWVVKLSYERSLELRSSPPVTVDDELGLESLERGIPVGVVTVRRCRRRKLVLSSDGDVGDAECVATLWRSCLSHSSNSRGGLSGALDC